jgi:hypothetical protein
MSRTTTRLRRLEAAMRGPRQVRIVWSNTSDPAEWDRKTAEMIARGEASPNDEFMCIGWLPPVAGSADEPAPE